MIWQFAYFVIARNYCQNISKKNGGGADYCWGLVDGDYQLHKLYRLNK